MGYSSKVKLYTLIIIIVFLTILLLQTNYNQQVKKTMKDVIQQQQVELRKEVKQNLKLEQLTNDLRSTIHKLIAEIHVQKAEREKEQSNVSKNKATTLCDDPTPSGRFVLSYSLFGKGAEYYGRFIKNVAEEARSLETYKDFTLRVYVDGSFSDLSRKGFKANHSNVRFCDVRRIPTIGDISSLIGTVWRFIPIGDLTLDVMCSRDLDSPLLQRGGDAVKEWLGTNKMFHIMRDRETHTAIIMGGLWCFRVNKSPNLSQELLDTVIARSRSMQHTTADQTIAALYIWPKVKYDSLQHDAYLCKSFSGSKPFPTQRKVDFVGCVRNCWVYPKQKCPVDCRPPDHKEWEYC